MQNTRSNHLKRLLREFATDATISAAKRQKWKRKQKDEFNKRLIDAAFNFEFPQLIESNVEKDRTIQRGIFALIKRGTPIKKRKTVRSMKSFSFDESILFEGIETDNMVDYQEDSKAESIQTNDVNKYNLELDHCRNLNMDKGNRFKSLKEGYDVDDGNYGNYSNDDNHNNDDNGNDDEDISLTFETWSLEGYKILFIYYHNPLYYNNFIGVTLAS